MKDKKIYLKIAVVSASSTLLVLFLRYLVRGSAANWIVDFLQEAFKFDFHEAKRIYQYVVRNNLDYIMIATIAMCIVFLSVLVVSYSRKQQAKNAKLEEQRKNDLITYLAHDIRTPLTSVIGYLCLLDESPNMTSEQRIKYVQVGLEKAYRLETLVNQFFEITKYGLQTTILSKKNVDLYYMLMQLADEAYPQLLSHGKEVLIQVIEELTVYGDPDKLARAFNNILKNAISYGEDNSIINISAYIKKDCAFIEFKNVGRIPKDKLSAIFDKFSRLDKARSSDTGGAGLGLAIAKEIITMHDGEIHAMSENGYTVFTIRLPLMG